MRKTLATLLLAAAIPTVVLAMPDSPRAHPEHGRHAPMAHHGAKGLNLTPEQRQQAAQISKEAMQARHEINKRYLEKLPATEQQAMQNELKATQDKQQNDFRALLNAEQKKAYEASQKQREERRAEYEAFKQWQATQKTN